MSRRRSGPSSAATCWHGAVDRAGADMVLHGHAHYGSRDAVTPGGVRVLNVAQAVIHRPFLTLELDPDLAPTYSPSPAG